jgi:hypothetical protein
MVAVWPQLQAMLAYVRDGDTVIVHSMDRLARNLDDLRRLVRELTGRGVAVQLIKEQLTFSAGQRLVQHAVAADALDADAAGLQVERDVAPGDRTVPEGGLLRDQDVPAGGVRPGGAAVVEPGEQRLVAEVAGSARRW